jgi:hypothetical protein
VTFGCAIILLCNTNEISLGIWDIAMTCIKKSPVAVTPEDGTENMLKHVECNFNI